MHRGRNGDNVTSNTMGTTKIGRKDLLKISKNVLFDKTSIEDLKRFSNNVTASSSSAFPDPKILLKLTQDGEDIHI